MSGASIALPTVFVLRRSPTHGRRFLARSRTARAVSAVSSGDAWLWRRARRWLIHPSRRF
eukprot:6196879-Pleurochrysis_carterae.AAC.1